MVLWLGEGTPMPCWGASAGGVRTGGSPGDGAGADGKPYFPGEPELHFNVSHSGGLALCGAGRPPGGGRGGAAPRRPGLARYVCSEAESAWLERQGGDWGRFTPSGR